MSLKDYLNLYEFECELPGTGEKVRYKGLSTNLMKKLLIYENEDDPVKGEDILDSFINLTIINESFDIDNIYVRDRYYLFIKIREATKGSEYEFSYTCPNCKSQVLQSIDLNNLLISKPQIKDNEIYLMDDKIVMELSFPLRKQQKEAFNYINSKDNRERQVDIQLADYASHVNKIVTQDEGELKVDYKELMEFIGDLPDFEKEKFDNWIEENKFGINLEYELCCVHCDYKQKQVLPMNSFFQ